MCKNRVMSHGVNDTPVIDTTLLGLLLVVSAIWVACCIGMFVLHGGFGRHDVCMDDECERVYEMHEDAPPVPEMISTIPRPIPRRAVDDFYADFDTSRF